MTTAAITLDELLADNEAATQKWQAWFAGNPAALEVPCAIYQTVVAVQGLLKHRSLRWSCAILNGFLARK